jgi:hypothetical protein
MNKIDILIKEFPDEFYQMVDALYDEKIKKKVKEPSKSFKFRVLGKTYDDKITTNNYISFIKDVSKIHPNEMFEQCIKGLYISRELTDTKQLYKINDSLYISGYSSNETKRRHIMSICDLIEVDLKVL